MNLQRLTIVAGLFAADSVCYVQIRTHAEIESDDGVPTD